jgi:hypothetical protein
VPIGLAKLSFVSPHWDGLLGINRDLETMSIVGIVTTRIVGGAAMATVAVGVVLVALMLVESLSQSPDEIAKGPTE